MADALPDLPGLGQLGAVLTLLAVLYVRLLMHHRQDRGEARAEKAELRKAHAAELATARARIAELEEALNKQRRATWRAEDAAARYRRQLGLPDTIDLGADGDR